MYTYTHTQLHIQGETPLQKKGTFFLHPAQSLMCMCVLYFVFAKRVWNELIIIIINEIISFIYLISVYFWTNGIVWRSVFGPSTTGRQEEENQARRGRKQAVQSEASQNHAGMRHSHWNKADEGTTAASATLDNPALTAVTLTRDWTWAENWYTCDLDLTYSYTPVDFFEKDIKLFLHGMLNKVLIRPCKELTGKIKVTRREKKNIRIISRKHSTWWFGTCIIPNLHEAEKTHRHCFWTKCTFASAYCVFLPANWFSLWKSAIFLPSWGRYLGIAAKSGALYQPTSSSWDLCATAAEIRRLVLASWLYQL